MVFWRDGRLGSGCVAAIRAVVTLAVHSPFHFPFSL